MNVDSLDQWAVPKILSIGTPILTALEAEAPLVECAENLDVSIPADFRTFLIQCPTVEGVAELKGRRVVTKRDVAPDAPRGTSV